MYFTLVINERRFSCCVPERQLGLPGDDGVYYERALRARINEVAACAQDAISGAPDGDVQAGPGSEQRVFTVNLEPGTPIMPV